MSFKTKTQREALKRKEKELDRRLQSLLILFGSHLLKSRGIIEPITQEELEDFAKKLK